MKSPLVVRMKDLPSSIQRKLRHFEKQVRIHEMKGAHDPDIWDTIERSYQEARQDLLNLLYHYRGL